MCCDKTVFISGSNRGIGRECVKIFASNGWNIIAHARYYSDEFEKYLSDICTQTGITITPIYFELTDEQDIKKQIKEIISAKKITIDVVINNAGICDIKLFMLTPLEDIRNMFEINLFSHMKVSQLLLKRMPNGSSIINVASYDAISPQKGESAYASCKSGLIAWTKVLALELAGKTSVYAVAPQAVDTDMANKIKEKANWTSDELIAPQKVAEIIYKLAINGADNNSGDVVIVEK